MKAAAVIIAAFSVIAVSAVIFLPRAGQQETYSVSPDGIVAYANRPPAQFTIVSETADGNVSVKRIELESRGGIISGVLRMPKAVGKLPAFVILPGATVPAGTNLEQDLNRLGFITLGLDQRGTGQTKEQAAGMQQDFMAFANGQEPVQHKMLHDALAAVDILESLPEIDGGKLYIGGESMGARFAIMAAATEPVIKGVLAISTAGYGYEQIQDPAQRAFVRSIDPYNYIAKISPRPLIFIHGDGDPVIPIALGRDTFEKASGPKEFVEVKSRGHGYGPAEMLPVISEKLAGWK